MQEPAGTHSAQGPVRAAPSEPLQMTLRATPTSSWPGEEGGGELGQAQGHWLGAERGCGTGLPQLVSPFSDYRGFLRKPL